jgi:glyoxylate/hydroxypyruvate reductase
MAEAGTGKIHIHFDHNRALGPVFEVTPERLDAALARYPDVARCLHVTMSFDCEGIDAQLATTEVLFVWRFDPARLAERAPRLRWIHLPGAGIEHLAPFDWLPKGVTLTNNRGVHGARADEYAIMAVLMLNNRVPEMMTNQRLRRWEQVFNTGIAGKTLLVIGVGHVGGGIARLAKLFGMNTLGVRRSGAPHPQVDEMYAPAQLSDLVPRADYIIMTAPSTAETRHLFGRKEINLMRPGSGLVNYSRAGLVDYDALCERLDRREVSAILDAFRPEPLPAESRLWHTPNLIITPHCSSDDPATYTPRTLDLVFDNLRRLIAGEPLQNVVDPTLEY